jgi:hypothetical protein
MDSSRRASATASVLFPAALFPAALFPAALFPAALFPAALFPAALFPASVTGRGPAAGAADPPLPARTDPHAAASRHRMTPPATNRRVLMSL